MRGIQLGNFEAVGVLVGGWRGVGDGMERMGM